MALKHLIQKVSKRLLFFAVHAAQPKITRMRLSIDAFPRMNASLTNSRKKHDRMKIRNYSIQICLPLSLSEILVVFGGFVIYQFRKL